jgi:branched-chain amino acid aminotransferase/4-amino-4-deoxychorismate lyase
MAQPGARRSRPGAVSEGAASVPLEDRGLLLGDGLFETMLAVSGRPAFFAEHLARLQRGCAALGLPAPEAAAARGAVAEALAAAGLTAARAAVRLTWTAGSGGRGLDRPQPLKPRLFVGAALAPAPTAPARLAVVSIRRNPDSPTSRLKTLAYLDNVLARREALAAGADEAVMLNTRGEVACAAAANIFWLKDGRLCTPALDCGALDGITRARVLELAASMGQATAEVREGEDGLAAAEAIFLTSSLAGVRAAGRPGGRATSAAHPLTMALARAWEARLSA